ncbi:C4-dicarboxylate TRAP transporter substrate-binding protein [Enterocloster asparagiformis]|uniref:C4-dicarboxylate TRAP transporter substrate-binding protein n=1 Tax=Enterocloster asparagiformis TaxID=333367 RepID=UPI002A81419B|nr:C4-dicarboxylate TRAP transporter substrate-binding protein [Enterocloster asparagiformis]
MATSAAAQEAQTESAASKESQETSTETAQTPERNVLTIQIGFENTTEEPIGKAVEKWAELLEAESNGTMKLQLFPNSSLGSKSELIDQMIMGENIITIADGAFYADYGVPDLGILYGPFFFDNWNEVWKLIDSDWYKAECGKLADKGLTVLTSNWVYGERELMTKTKVVTPADIKGKKIRLANSQIYVEGFNALGATAVPMALGDVYTSLQNGTLDGVENPLSTLYGQSFQEVSKNILMTGHILNFTTWCIGTDYLNTLTPEQQELLYRTGEEAGLYNNEQQAAANDDYRKKLEDAGVTFTELTDEERALWKEASLSFYEKGSQFGWSEDLYNTVKAAVQ